MTWLADIAGRMPWWAKIGGKIVLSRLPVSGKTWQKIGLFSPGLMATPEYAMMVFDRHYRAAGSPAPGFSYLELGPGDSFASAVVGRGYGAAGGWLIDSGSYASRDMGLYRDLAARVESERPGVDLGFVRQAGSIDDVLAQTQVIYRENGLDSLREVPEESCDLIFSEVVLEHVPRNDFAPVLSEFFRILKAGGVASHRVDFRDHLGGGWQNLRFSEGLWEAPWFARESGFYTNRFRLSEILAISESVGFRVEICHREFWPSAPLSRTKLDKAFRDLDDEDLLTRCVDLKFVRPA